MTCLMSNLFCFYRFECVCCCFPVCYNRRPFWYKLLQNCRVVRCWPLSWCVRSPCCWQSYLHLWMSKKAVTTHAHVTDTRSILPPRHVTSAENPRTTWASSKPYRATSTKFEQSWIRNNLKLQSASGRCRISWAWRNPKGMGHNQGIIVGTLLKSLTLTLFCYFFLF